MRRTHRSRMQGWGTGVLMAAGVFGASAWVMADEPAQEAVETATETNPETGTDAGEQPGQAPGEETARRRMLRRVLEMRAERARQAIDALDNGRSLEDIRREFLGDLALGPGGEGGEAGGGERRRGQRPWDSGMIGPGGGPPGMDEMDGLGGPRGDGPMGDGERPRQMVLREMTDADVETIRSIVSRVTPRLAERLEQFAQRNPEQAKQRYQRMFMRMRPLIDLKEIDPEMFELKIREISTARLSWEQARRVLRLERGATLGTADAGEAEAARAALRGTLGELFDVRVAVRQREQEMARLRMEQMAKELELAVAGKDDRIATQLDEIMSRVSSEPADAQAHEEEEALDGLSGRPPGLPPPPRPPLHE